MTRVAMPSPTGRNVEQLFLPPRLALDASRRANDGTSASAAALSARQIFLNEKLSNPEDLSQAESLVEQLLKVAVQPDEGDDADDDETAAQDKLAGDRRVVRIQRQAARMSFDAHQRTEDEMSRLFPDAVLPRRA